MNKPALSTESGSALEQRTVSPRTDIYEYDDAYELVADMPGVPADRVDVVLERNSLVLRGSSALTGEPDQQQLRREFHATHFERRFSLGQSVDEQRIEASASQGVVKVRLPKRQEQQPRKISVQSA